jgi:hypothetical protein
MVDHYETTLFTIYFAVLSQHIGGLRRGISSDGLWERTQAHWGDFEPGRKAKSTVYKLIPQPGVQLDLRILMENERPIDDCFTAS